MTRIVQKVNDLMAGESLERRTITCPIPVVQSVIDEVVERYGSDLHIIFVVVEIRIEIDVRVPSASDLVKLKGGNDGRTTE